MTDSIVIGARDAPASGGATGVILGVLIALVAITLGIWIVASSARTFDHQVITDVQAPGIFLQMPQSASS